MALIKCPECGKEVSDTIKTCPHCGYKIKNRKMSKKIQIVFALLIVLVIILALFIGMLLHRSKQYNKAIAILNDGDYQTACSILEKISSYKDSKDLLEQAKYESTAFECINLFIDDLSQPDTLKIKKVSFYQMKFKKDASKETKESYQNILDNNPDISKLCVIEFSAKSTNGKKVNAYVLFQYDGKDWKKYGVTDTLETDLDLAGVLALHTGYDELGTRCQINMCYDSLAKCGKVNIDRINSIINNDNYISVN